MEIKPAKSNTQKRFEAVIEIIKNASLFVWEKVKVFWITLAVPWLKGLTPKKVLMILGVSLLIGILFIVSMFIMLSFGLPTVESLKDYKPSPGTIIYAEDGRVLGQVRIEKGSYVPLSRIPQFLTNALLATEDP